MAKILVLGGGLAGCSASQELTRMGHRVFLIEKEATLGGKVRQFGCKASERCNNCGVCIGKDIFEQVEENPLIERMTCSTLLELFGTRGDYCAVIKTPSGLKNLDGIDAIMVCVGFDQQGTTAGSVEFDANDSVITGMQLEQLLKNRGKSKLRDNQPKSVAFVHCFGSRDAKEKTEYCSRVCCGYATRAALALREYDPQMRIAAFYMDLQQVEEGEYAKKLSDRGIELIRSKPIQIKKGAPAIVRYDRPDGTGMAEEEFDLVVLAEGIHPPRDAERLAEVCGLRIEKHGFLKELNPTQTGIVVAGCASGPKKIAETAQDALTAARELAQSLIR